MWTLTFHPFFVFVQLLAEHLILGWDETYELPDACHEFGDAVLGNSDRPRSRIARGLDAAEKAALGITDEALEKHVENVRGIDTQYT